MILSLEKYLYIITILSFAGLYYIFSIIFEFLFSLLNLFFQYVEFLRLFTELFHESIIPYLSIGTTLVLTTYFVFNIKESIRDFLNRLLENNLEESVNVIENLWCVTTKHGPVYYTTIKEECFYITEVVTKNDKITLSPLGLAKLSLRPVDINNCLEISKESFIEEKIVIYKGDNFTL